MGPKSKTAINDWRATIEDAVLNDSTWRAQVVLMESAAGDQAQMYLNKFETFAMEEKRFVIKNICRTETLFMVNQLGAEKKIKDESLRVFEEGQLYLKDKLEIPTDILALIIKHLILKMKEEYIIIRRQRLEVEAGLRQESSTMIKREEVRGTAVEKPIGASQASPGKGKGKPKVDTELSSPPPEPVPGKKYNTVLRERGEDWRDRIYVDDFPLDGPNLYIAITGFMEPSLVACLIKIGIPIAAVIQIRINTTSISVPSTLIRPVKRGQSQTEMFGEKCLKFWTDLQNLRITENVDDFKNTAFMTFFPPYSISDPLSGEPDKIYDELSYLMYDVQDCSRQRDHYLDNMQIIHVPTDDIDVRYKKCYDQLIEDLPFECVTMFSLLDSVLQTACKDNLDEISSTISSTPYIPTLQDYSQKAETLVVNVFNTLCKTEEDKIFYRITYGEEFESHKDPVVIKYGDFVKYTTFHLGNINLYDIVKSTLLRMPLHMLWLDQDPPTGEREAKINFHVNVLLSCFERTDVETSELVRLLHILACRKLFNNRSSLKKQHLNATTIEEFKKNSLKRTIPVEPLPRCTSPSKNSNATSLPSFPSMTKNENVSLNSPKKICSEEFRVKYLFDCPDISELVSAVEIANEQPIDHLIDDFEYFEDFSGIRSSQILLENFTKFNCVDYKYCEVTDCFIFMFYNSYNKDGITRDEYCCHIPTPVCFQDFFNFVLEENHDWIQAEEKIYDETIILKKQSTMQDVFDPFAATSCLDDENIAADLLMEGSLKHKDTIYAAESSVHSLEPGSSVSGKKTDQNNAKQKVSNGASKTNKIFVNAENASSNEVILVKLPFTGYDLGDRRVEVFGRDAFFFSKDGTRVTSSYSILIPGDFENLMLHVFPGNGNSHIYIHRALGAAVTPEILKMNESFRIDTKDHVLMNITKQSYQVLKNSSSSSFVETKKSKAKAPVSAQSMIEKVPEFDTKYYYSFCITWPNGLITESVNNNDSADISYIKQYNLASINDEDARCISLNGEVVIFKKSGEIEVLQPDGTYIIITKYGKRVIAPLVPELDIPLIEAEKKSKKEKLSKKSKVLDEIVEEVEKPLEYELVIDEFEVINADGLRQKWIDDNATDTEKLVIRNATDYVLGEVFRKRMDGTNILLNKDGIQIVSFPNKTKIITNFIVQDQEIFPEWTEEEKELFDIYENIVEEDNYKSKASVSQKSYASSSAASSGSKKLEEGGEEEETNSKQQKERNDGYVVVHLMFTIEHDNYTTVTINKIDGKITIDSPNSTSLTVDPDNNYNVILDNETSANFNGEYLHMSYEACTKCKSFTTCSIQIENNSDIDRSVCWLTMKDSAGKTLEVTRDGDIQLTADQFSQDVTSTSPAEDTTREGDWKSESSFTPHGKCQDMYQAKKVKFMVLNRDLECSEIVHRSLLEQYKKTCRWQPWCSINQYDTFTDNRTLHSILTPVNCNETEKWVMESKFSAKPKNLAYQDLKEEKTSDHYHWMRPYEKFEPQPVKITFATPTLPKAYILRTLEQQWHDKDRDQRKGGKELLYAILQYRKLLETQADTMLHLPIVDIRSPEAKTNHELVQALAHLIYEDLKRRVEQDVQNRAKLAITTKPVPPPTSEELFEAEESEATTTPEIELEEEPTIVEQVEEAAPINSNLKRYWRRRAEEMKEEEFYLYLLRAGTVPKYFLNILGGSIWWDVNHTTDHAVAESEKRKMKCVCSDEQSTSRDQTEFSVPLK